MQSTAKRVPVHARTLTCAVRVLTVKALPAVCTACSCTRSGIACCLYGAYSYAYQKILWKYLARICTRIIRSKASVCRGKYLYAQPWRVFVRASSSRRLLSAAASICTRNCGKYSYVQPWHVFVCASSDRRLLSAAARICTRIKVLSNRFLSKNQTVWKIGLLIPELVVWN